MNKTHYNARTGLWDDDVSSGSYVFEEGGPWYFKAFARGSIERHGPYGHENAARDAYYNFADETLRESATREEIVSLWAEHNRLETEAQTDYESASDLEAGQRSWYAKRKAADAVSGEVMRLLGDRFCRLPNGRALVPFDAEGKFHPYELTEVSDL